MPLMTFSIQHGWTFEEARQHLATAVDAVTRRFGVLVRRVEWSTDRSQVRLEGIGFWIAMQVNAQVIHVSADIPVLGRLLRSSVTTHLKAIVRRTFQRTLPPDPSKA
jgi:Putative polyhydroxyalkanoic acid system protein (PHA_gran_rgn)